MAKYNYKFIFKHGAHRIADLSPKTSSKKNGRLFGRGYDACWNVLKTGAIEVEDMLPEVAVVKHM